jgi:3'-phosphoadenosine 5'-phosphosulfate sulfotransferase (PAPS reductase)/FAD synthetase
MPDSALIDTLLKHREAMDCDLVTLPRMAFWNNSVKTAEQKAHIIDRAQTLQAGINRPFEDKLLHARKVIKQSLEVAGVNWAVSYSAGRDSTALSHLMTEEIGIRHVPHIMSNTRMEYPETLQMFKVWKLWLAERGVECHQVFPEMRPKELWPLIGVPLWSKQIAYKYRKFAASKSDKIPAHTPEDLHDQFRQAKAAGLKITEKCCDYLKKKPMKKWDKENNVQGHFTGVRCSESRARRLAWITSGALYQAVHHGGLWISNPLAFWTDADVARYLDERKIHVLRPDTLSGGSGCVTCMFGCRSRAQEGTPNAMQDLKTRNPKMWQTALDDWGYREVLDQLGIPYE